MGNLWHFKHLTLTLSLWFMVFVMICCILQFKCWTLFESWNANLWNFKVNLVSSWLWHSVCFETVYNVFISVLWAPWRDLLPLAGASSAPWRWHSSPARLLPWRWLQPGPVCRRRQRRSWRREGWCSRSSLPRSKHPPPSQRPLPAGRRIHDENLIKSVPESADEATQRR